MSARVYTRYSQHAICNAAALDSGAGGDGVVVFAAI